MDSKLAFLTVITRSHTWGRGKNTNENIEQYFWHTRCAGLWTHDQLFAQDCTCMTNGPSSGLQWRWRQEWWSGQNLGRDDNVMHDLSWNDTCDAQWGTLVAFVSTQKPSSWAHWQCCWTSLNVAVACSCHCAWHRNHVLGHCHKNMLFSVVILADFWITSGSCPFHKNMKNSKFTPSLNAVIEQHCQHISTHTFASSGFCL